MDLGLQDLWARTKNETATQIIGKTVPPHGAVAMVLSAAGPELSGLFPPAMYVVAVQVPSIGNELIWVPWNS
jgi:hypothetical protein